MTNTPFHKCIFTIKKSRDLDAFYANGRKGEIREGRRWVEASSLHAEAEVKGQSLIVVFAAGEYVDDLLYYAVLDRIRVHANPKVHETIFEFSDVKPFTDPAPHKTDLILVNSKENISDGHIRPYSICRTPPVLLGATLSSPPLPLPQVEHEPLTIKNILSETNEIVSEVMGKQMGIANTDIFRSELYDPHQQHMKDNKRRREAREIKELFSTRHGLTIDEGEIERCNTVVEVAKLVRREFNSQKA